MLPMIFLKENHVQTKQQQSVKALLIYLIKVSKYDDGGYVIRHWRGVLPSNSLSCLYGLTEDVRRRGAFGRDLNWKIEVLDESVHSINVKKIIRWSRRPHTKTICSGNVRRWASLR